ncbi:MAG: hypothetical protein EOS09_33200 [Mesorhizobium sp.]|nr:MAG: hypothetical protein EOS09_33200 [Mesorhizobium sp.]
MITVVPTDRIYLCCGATDMRRGINSLARMVQQGARARPHTGAIFCFRGHKGHIIKILAHDDQGFCTSNILRRRWARQAASRMAPPL